MSLLVKIRIRLIAEKDGQTTTISLKSDSGNVVTIPTTNQQSEEQPMTRIAFSMLALLALQTAVSLWDLEIGKLNDSLGLSEQQQQMCAEERVNREQSNRHQSDHIADMLRRSNAVVTALKLKITQASRFSVNHMHGPGS
jgi:hypothetical protein